MAQNTAGHRRQAKASDDYVKVIVRNRQRMGGQKLTTTEKQARLDAIMSSRDGFSKIGNQMIGPIQLKLRYQGLVRNVLVEDPTVPGVPIEYDVNNDEATAYTLHSNEGEVKITPFEGKRLPVSTFRIAAFPTVKKEDLYELRLNMVDYAQDQARQSIQKQEDAYLLTILDAAVEHWATRNPKRAEGNTNKVEVAEEHLTPDHFYDAVANVDAQELEAKRVLMSPYDYRDIYRWNMLATGDQFKNEVVAGQKVTSYGEFQLGRSVMIPKGTTYLTPEPEFLGVMPIRYSLDVVENPKPEAFTPGWVMDEVIGMAILNPRGIVKINKV